MFATTLALPSSGTQVSLSWETLGGAPCREVAIRRLGIRRDVAVALYFTESPPEKRPK
jgi:hypothetical protein